MDSYYHYLKYENTCIYSNSEPILNGGILNVKYKILQWGTNSS